MNVPRAGGKSYFHQSYGLVPSLIVQYVPLDIQLAFATAFSGFFRILPMDIFALVESLLTSPLMCI